MLKYPTLSKTNSKRSLHSNEFVAGHLGFDKKKKKIMRCSKLKLRQPESERKRTASLLIAVNSSGPPLTRGSHSCTSVGIQVEFPGGYFRDYSKENRQAPLSARSPCLIAGERLGVLPTANPQQPTLPPCGLCCLSRN